MSISNEEVISSAIQVVSEALKGGIVPICSIYAQLLLKNFKLEHEIKQLRKNIPSDNSYELEKANTVDVQNKNITTKLLKQSSALISKSHLQSKEDELSASLLPLSGCRCYSCTYSILLKTKKKYKIKAKSEDIRQLNNNDTHWAIYRDITVCEILYIGHKNDKSFLDQSKTKIRAIGATIRFPSEDIREYFVSLQDLFFIKASDCRGKHSNYSNDSGYGASVACNLQVDTDLAISNGSSSTPKNNTKFNKKSLLQRDLHPLSSTYLCANKKSANICPRERIFFRTVTKECQQSQSFPSQSRCLEYCEFLKVPSTEKRRCSLQESTNKCFSYYREYPRRTSNTCCETSKQSTCDSAISLGSSDNSLRHCRSNQELCQCCPKHAPVHDYCRKPKILNSPRRDSSFSCPCDRQNYNSMTHTHTDYCSSCHSQFCLCNHKVE